jgi:EAL domain-containing protein (putative c-di-GMP-specific phosphodiesterase class I)
MFCCLSPRAIPTLNGRDLATMRVFAGLAARQVNAELEQRLNSQGIHARIASALENRDYTIVFQPIFDLATSNLTGCEALCRFSALPYRSPDKWFADASAVGLGTELEVAVAEAAIAAFPTLPRGLSMSVNASPEAMIGGRMSEVLASPYADRTIVEITEHAKVSDYEALHRVLGALKERGVRVAVDDAGAGYSGLQHIVQLAPDIIKLDMSLTRAVDSDPGRRALTSAMVFYAREMGCRVVAEGIETMPELQTLKLLGVNMGQGYFLGKPGDMTALSAAPALTASLAA